MCFHYLIQHVQALHKYFFTNDRKNCECFIDRTLLSEYKCMQFYSQTFTKAFKFKKHLLFPITEKRNWSIIFVTHLQNEVFQFTLKNVQNFKFVDLFIQFVLRINNSNSTIFSFCRKSMLQRYVLNYYQNRGIGKFCTVALLKNCLQFFKSATVQNLRQLNMTPNVFAYLQVGIAWIDFMQLLLEILKCTS